MRRSLLVGTALLATLALSACASSNVKASLHQFVGSVGSQPNVQMTFTLSASGPGTAEAQSLDKRLSLEIALSNPNGGAVSASNGDANASVAFLDEGSPIVQVRDVDSNLYVNVDVTKLARIPGINISQVEAAGAQLLLGGRWLEVPKSLLDSVLPKEPSASASHASAEEAVVTKVIDALTNVIVTSHYTTLPSGGYTETGTLKSLGQSLSHALPQFLQHSLDAKAPQGTYSLTITTSGASATGGSVSVTVPRGASGSVTGSVSVAVAHADQPVTAPKGATSLTPSFLRQLETSAL